MERLFVYGTLMPGKENHHHIQGITGTWEQGCISGTLYMLGWGADKGCPGVVLDEKGQKVEGYVLTSDVLTEYWSELDAFEGEEYRRVLTTVTFTNGDKAEAYVYTLRSLDNAQK